MNFEISEDTHGYFSTKSKNQTLTLIFYTNNKLIVKHVALELPECSLTNKTKSLFLFSVPLIVNLKLARDMVRKEIYGEGLLGEHFTHNRRRLPVYICQCRCSAKHQGSFAGLINCFQMAVYPSALFEKQLVTLTFTVS